MAGGDECYGTQPDVDLYAYTLIFWSLKLFEIIFKSRGPYPQETCCFSVIKTNRLMLCEKIFRVIWILQNVTDCIVCCITYVSNCHPVSSRYEIENTAFIRYSATSFLNIYSTRGMFEWHCVRGVQNFERNDRWRTSITTVLRTTNTQTRRYIYDTAQPKAMICAHW
jgi:hypothetical protein